MNRMTHVSVRSARDISASSILIGALRENIKADRPGPTLRRLAVFGPGIE